MKEVKVGVVGLGRFGRLHARILSELPGCRVSALCEIDGPTLEGCGKEYGVEGALYETSRPCWTRRIWTPWTS